MKRLFALGCAGVLLSMLAQACVYDDSERCGPNEQIISNDRCACIDGYVPGSSGCVACGEHERASGEDCVCEDGFARPAEGRACEPPPPALGEACGPDFQPCATDFPLCQASSNGDRYCTNACEEDGDCTGGYKCHRDGDDGYCRRPAIGYGDSCKVDDDCTDGEATYCEKIQQHVCLVPCSAGHTDGCFEGEVCCDFVVFSPICVPSDACGPNGGNEVP